MKEVTEQSSPTPQKPQIGSLAAGQRNVRFGRYNWRVLDVQNGKALLLAEEILEKRRYHSEWTEVTWKDCELRKYLNGEFLGTFSSQEQSRIAQAENTNADNQWYGTPGGSSTVDRVFLLSIEEVVKYFGDSGQLQKRPKGGAWWIDDQYNSARKANHDGRKWWWWLRPPGIDDSNAAFVSIGGYLSLLGNTVGNGGGVRPALWLNLESDYVQREARGPSSQVF